MEKDERKKKRGREGGDSNKDSSSSSPKKKIDLTNHHHHNNHHNVITYENEISNNNDDVFDFPWLHEDGMISKSEEWGAFEDAFTFSSSLDTMIAGGGGYEYSGEEGVCSLIDIPAFDDNKINLDGEDGVDCIWSSLLDQPLQQKQQASHELS